MEVNAINVSWSQKSSTAVAVMNAEQTFLLTISHGSTSKTVSLSESFYYFTAPENAPQCEVYHFSVTASYVGAVYTGADCSVPSQVLSRMLPAPLPDMNEYQSYSVSHDLAKQADGGIRILVSLVVSKQLY